MKLAQPTSICLNFNYSWGSTSWVWRFARDMDHAVDQAIEIGIANILEHGKRLEAENKKAQTQT